jgi:hypothetical protein
MTSNSLLTLTWQLENGCPGFATKITCPVHLQRVIPRWWERVGSDGMRNSLLKRASDRATAQFSFHCSSCHRASSLFVTNAPPLQPFLLNLHPAQRDAFEAARDAYTRGIASEVDFFSVIEETFVVAEGCTVMNAILFSIADVERRAVLQGRYLRAFPRISAPCCGSGDVGSGKDDPSLDHCFQCSVRWMGSGHEGLTCAQFRASRATEDEIVPCPLCGLQLVKGDGCNSVKCVCGHAFNWGTAAVEAVRELAEAYERQHGDATAITCAQEVYDAAFNGASTSSVTSLSSSSSSSSSSPPPGSSKASAQATAWADNHPEELARARAALFAARHRPFAAQACVRLQTTTAPSHRDHVLARAFGRAHRGAVETVKRSRKAAQVRQWGALHGGGGGTWSGGGVCGGDMGLSALYAYYGLVGGRKKLIGYLEGERRGAQFAHGSWMAVEGNYAAVAAAEKGVLRRRAAAWDFLARGGDGGCFSFGGCGGGGSGGSGRGGGGYEESAAEKEGQGVDVPAAKALECLDDRRGAAVRALSEEARLLLDSWVRFHEHGRLAIARARRWEERQQKQRDGAAAASSPSSRSESAGAGGGERQESMGDGSAGSSAGSLAGSSAGGSKLEQHATDDYDEGESPAAAAALDIEEGIARRPAAAPERLDLGCWLKLHADECGQLLARRRERRVRSFCERFGGQRSGGQSVNGACLSQSSEVRPSSSAVSGEETTAAAAPPPPTEGGVSEASEAAARHALSVVPFKRTDHFKGWLERARRAHRSSPAGTGGAELLAVIAWAEANRASVEAAVEAMQRAAKASAAAATTTTDSTLGGVGVGGSGVDGSGVSSGSGGSGGSMGGRAKNKHRSGGIPAVFWADPKKRAAQARIPASALRVPLRSGLRRPSHIK